MRGDNGSGGQCIYPDDLLIAGSDYGDRIQGYYGNEYADYPPMQTGYLRVETDDVIFDGFEVSGPSSSLYEQPTPPNQRAKLGVSGGDDVLFRHLYIHGINNTDDYCKAITAWGGGSLTVGNVIELSLGCSSIKNSCHLSNPSITFVNCTFDRLGNDTYIGGFYRSGGSAMMNNSIWTDCGDAGFYYVGRSTDGPLDIDYSAFCDTSTLPDGGIYFFQVSPDLGCLIDQDPLYVDPLSDHHLQDGSPCVDSGDPDILDYDDSRSDMGCYGGPHGDWDFEN